MRVMFVEDDAAVSASLKALLESWGLDCLSFPNAEAFLAYTGKPPDCILLDVRLPGMDGMTALRDYRQRDAQTPIIIMTGHGDVTMAVEALKHGAQDFVEKPFDGEDLVTRIKAEVAKAQPDVACREKLESLTPREQEVLRGVIAGQQNKVIAHNLGISQKTVELHRSRVMDKTGSRSVSQLIQTALRGGFEAES